jgi:hypothetical protein
MSTIQDLAVLRDGWAKIGQLSCVPHLEPAIGAMRLAGARMNAIWAVSQRLAFSGRSTLCQCALEAKKPPGTAHAPTRSPCFCFSHSVRHHWRARKDSQKQADGGRAERVCWPHQRFDPRCDFMWCAPGLAPKVCCAVTADMLLTPTTPRRSVPGSVQLAVDGSDTPPAVVHGADCLSRICAMFDFNGRSKVVQISITMDVVSAMLTDISVPVHID